MNFVTVLREAGWRRVTLHFLDATPALQNFLALEKPTTLVTLEVSTCSCCNYKGCVYVCGRANTCISTYAHSYWVCTFVYDTCPPKNNVCCMRIEALLKS